MVSIKKSKKRSKNKYRITSKKKFQKYNIVKGGENTPPKLCKGRTKEQCNDGTGDCKYIEGTKRKYCKRVNICKKSCDLPCSKIENNGKLYCIPPDKNGNPRSLDDVKDILAEFEADINIESIESNELDKIELNDQENLNEKDNTQNININDNLDIVEEKILKTDQIVNIKSNITSSNKSNEINQENVNLEEGSVSSILYGKSNYDSSIGSCSIL